MSDVLAPVVVLHSLGLDGSSYSALAGSLGDRVVHRPDLRGHGTTNGPVTLDAMAADVAGLLHALDQPAHLVGHSMGGAVAGLVAERVPGLVASLAVVATPPAGLPVFRERAEAAAAGGMAAQVEETVRRWFTDDTSTTARSVRAALERVPVEVWVDAWMSFAGFRGWASLDLPDGLRPLCVSYAADRSTPPAALASIAETCGGRHLPVDHGGHMTPLEDPAGLAQLLEDHWKEVS